MFLESQAFLDKRENFDLFIPKTGEFYLITNVTKEKLICSIAKKKIISSTFK